MQVYRTKTVLPHHMESILVESWGAFRMSSRIYKVHICDNKYTPLIPSDFTTNIQEFSASVQVYYGSKGEEINEISPHTVSPIEVQETMTNDTMVFLQEKGIQ